MKEFGRIVTLVGGRPISQVEEKVLAHYETVKARDFPTWDGQPTIQTGSCPCGCGRFLVSGWVAEVPDEHVVKP